MPITNFAELGTAISDFMEFGGATEDTANLITLCEATLNRVVRHHRMIERSTATLDTRLFPVPTDWLETLRFSITAPSSAIRTLELASLDALFDERMADADRASVPRLYAHVGQEFEVWPQPDGEYTAELLYYQKIPALSVSNTTNWLLTLAPDVYLYGALISGHAYVVDDERLPVWTSLFTAAVQELNRASRNARFSGTGLKVRWRT